MSDFKIYIDFTKAREGGLSRDPHDTASKYPVPDGSGNHTNKGVTWEAFERILPKYGITPTPKLFYEMSDKTFNIIFEHYWNSAGANKIENQAIANLIFQSHWGGGLKQLVIKVQKYFKMKQTFTVDQLTAKMINDFTSKKVLYDYMHQWRLDYLRSTKTYKVHGPGWEARMKKLYEFNQRFL